MSDLNTILPQWHVEIVHVLSAAVQLPAMSWLLLDQRSALTHHYESNPEPEKKQTNKRKAVIKCHQPRISKELIIIFLSYCADL